MGGPERTPQDGEVVELFPKTDVSDLTLEQLLFSGLPNEDIVQAIAERIRYDQPNQKE